MTTTALDITTPADEPVIITSRFFKAPPELIFDAWTNPKHLANWWGPRRLELVGCDVDLRVGGAWRFVSRAPDGQEFAFRGEYLEVDQPHRLVATWIWEGMPDDVAVETLTLEAVDGGTMVHSEARHTTLAARDQHVENGMEGGLTESYKRLDELVESLQSARVSGG
jgi:uncharacterized protein YndB with AHSA1/START domain